MSSTVLKAQAANVRAQHHASTIRQLLFEAIFTSVLLIN
jgi:hypothetical protein